MKKKVLAACFLLAFISFALPAKIEAQTWRTGFGTDGKRNWVTCDATCGGKIWITTYDPSGKWYKNQICENPIPLGYENPETIPSVAMSPKGSFVVVWPKATNIWAQMFDGPGNSRGGNFMVNTGGAAVRPEVTMDSQGNFVIVWVDMTEVIPGTFTSTGPYSLWIQKYDFLGNPQGPNLRIDEDPSFITKNHPSIGMNPSGDFVIAWAAVQELHPLPGTVGVFGDGIFEAIRPDIYAQRFDKAGNPTGHNFRVSQAPARDWVLHRYTSAAMDSEGNFVICWDDSFDIFKDCGEPLLVYGQLYDSSGNPQGDNFLVDNSRGNNQGGPVVAMAPSGNFVVTWTESLDRDPAGWQNPEFRENYRGVLLYAQQFGPDGTPLTDAYLLHEQPLEDPLALIGVVAKDEQIFTAYVETYWAYTLENKIVTTAWATPKPTITAITYRKENSPGDVAELTISPTTPEKAYQVYYCDKLQENCWLPLGEPVKSSGTQVTVIDDGGTGSAPLSQVKSRFYKVKIP